MITLHLKRQHADGFYFLLYQHIFHMYILFSLSDSFLGIVPPFLRKKRNRANKRIEFRLDACRFFLSYAIIDR